MGTNTAGNLLVADGTNFNSIAVSSLSEISTAAADDVFIAIDTSGGGLKRIARSAVVAGLATDSAISNVVDDTTPQLGGNLDMNGADIVTTSNATIDLAPNGTGTVVVRGNTNSGAIVFNCESNSHGQTVIAQPHSASVTNTMLLPAGASSTLVSLVSTDTLTNKTLTSPKINEDVAVTSTASELNILDGVTSTATELNLLDGKAATNLALLGKQEGTDFTDSLLVGHATTGTLSSADKNTGVGIEALQSLTSGDDNTALGNAALKLNTAARRNIAIGSLAGDAILTGHENTAVGTFSLSGNQTGTGNTALGYQALSITTGAKNIAIGYDSGDNITSGDGNVIIGSINADSATGDKQLIIADGTDGSVAWIKGDSNGVVTFSDDIIIKDAGTIGSASDVDAIAIGADGDVTLTQDLELQHDGAILSFGANDEVTLTHVHNDGLLLNADMQLQFRDSAINIRSDADGDLDINADDEVEINSTLIDINGNVEMSGTLAQAGVATFAVAANVAQVAITSSSNAIAWDASAAANAYHLTTENTTFSAPSNAVEGAFIAVEINYDGSHTIAFNTIFEFAASTAPTTTDTNGKTDILVFRYNGAVWQEVGRTLNLSES